MAALLVGYALSDDKKLGETINKVFMQFVAPAGLIVVAGAMVAHAVLSHQRLAAEGDYESVGSYAATVTRVYPHAVEVETEFGVSLPVTAAMMPEVACFRGSRVEVDAAVVVSPAGQGDVRADGVGGFVDARTCKCTAGYGADVAMGDEPRGKWNGKARFYAVTAVRAAD